MFDGLHRLSLSCTATSPHRSAGSYMTWGEKQNAYIGESKALVMVMMTIIIIDCVVFNVAFSSLGYAGCPMISGQYGRIYT